MLSKQKISLFISLVLFSSNIFTAIPITPRTVMSIAEIKKIHTKRDYFYYQEMDTTTPIWLKTKRRYSHHFLKDRTKFFTMDQVIEGALTRNFTIQSKLQDLYQAKLGIHSKIGDILPKLSFSFGQDAGGLDIARMFSGVFGFLSPKNWMNLIHQKRTHQAAKLILKRTVLDEILNAKLLFLEQHQKIQDFEIRNFYLIHLQLLSEFYKRDSRALNTLFGRFALEGTMMASQRGETKLGFNTLTQAMALEGLDDDYTASSFNISDLKDFPKYVPNPSELEPMYRNKKIFLKNVIKKSVELEIVLKLMKISRLGVGISSVGNMFSTVDTGFEGDHDARFALNLGYDTLPNILISRSQYKVSKLEVRKEFISMLNIARKSFDFYTNSLGGYTEAKRSLKINREAFKANLSHMLKRGSQPDAFFLFSFNHLLDTELKLNNALHGSLVARAYMDRFLLVDNDNALSHLPATAKIREFFQDVVSKDKEGMERTFEISVRLSKVKRTRTLRKLLYKFNSLEGLEKLTKEEHMKAIRGNMDELLKSNLFRYKRRRFFELLASFIKEKKIELSYHQKNILQQRLDSFRRRAFGSKVDEEDYFNKLRLPESA